MTDRAAANGTLEIRLAEAGDAHALYLSEGFAPQDHALWPGGREVRWVKRLDGNPAVGPR